MVGEYQIMVQSATVGSCKMQRRFSSIKNDMFSSVIKAQTNSANRFYMLSCYMALLCSQLVSPNSKRGFGGLPPNYI